MTSLDKIEGELKGLGYKTKRITQNREVVIIQYKIPIGKYSGETVRLGFSLQDDGYPEYPPHWIHISPPYNDNLGGAVEQYVDEARNQWLAFSRPPADFWDKLPTKHMKFYINTHINRFCKKLK